MDRSWFSTAFLAVSNGGNGSEDFTPEHLLPRGRRGTSPQALDFTWEPGATYKPDLEKQSLPWPTPLRRWLGWVPGGSVPTLEGPSEDMVEAPGPVPRPKNPQ